MSAAVLLFLAEVEATTTGDEYEEGNSFSSSPSKFLWLFLRSVMAIDAPVAKEGGRRRREAGRRWDCSIREATAAEEEAAEAEAAEAAEVVELRLAAPSDEEPLEEEEDDASIEVLVENREEEEDNRLKILSELLRRFDDESSARSID
jgi:hypothetical protein